MTEPAIDPWQSGEAYERFMGRWSRRMSHRFLRWLDAPPQRSWADVGSGTGALVGGILEFASPLLVLGVEPAPAFLEFARGRVVDPRVRFLEGSADALPLETGSVDVLVSAFVLNFLPDPDAGLREMRRAVRPGGTVAAVVWDYLEGMGFLRQFWSAAGQLDPEAGKLDEGRRFPLCRPEPLRSLFASLDLVGVRVEAVEIDTAFAGFADYWQPFLGGTGPAPGYLASLSDERREELRALLEQRLPAGPDGTITLRARAWAVAGTVPGPRPDRVSDRRRSPGSAR